MTIYPGEHKILLSNSVIIALAGGGGRTTLCGGSHLLAKGDTFGDFSMRKTNWGRGGGGRSSGLATTTGMDGFIFNVDIVSKKRERG